MSDGLASIDTAPIRCPSCDGPWTHATALYGTVYWFSCGFGHGWSADMRNGKPEPAR